MSDVTSTKETPASVTVCDGTAHGKLSAGTLKLIAILSMFIDHYCAIFLEEGTQVYTIGRLIIGRLAFPIFAFFVMVGFVKTKNVYKYALRLLLFAVITEPIFDMGFLGSWIDWSHQNVMFTFFIAVATLYGIDHFGEGLHSKCSEKYGNTARSCFRLGVLTLGCVAAYFSKCDYTIFGVVLIVVLYQLRTQVKPCLIAGGILSLYSLYTGPLSFVLLSLYNGKRGLRLKYFFYIFYPGHVLLFIIIRDWDKILGLFA